MGEEEIESGEKSVREDERVRRESGKSFFEEKKDRKTET